MTTSRTRLSSSLSSTQLGSPDEPRGPRQEAAGVCRRARHRRLCLRRRAFRAHADFARIDGEPTYFACWSPGTGVTRLARKALRGLVPTLAELRPTDRRTLVGVAWIRSRGQRPARSGSDRVVGAADQIPPPGAEYWLGL